MNRTPAPPGKLHLRYRPPFDWPALLDHFAARAIEGVECVERDTYRRTVRLGSDTGAIVVRHDPKSARLSVIMSPALTSHRREISHRVRRLFDLDADIATISVSLARDSALQPLVNGRPGLRVPAGWNLFELGVRAILGQQVSVAAARRLIVRLTEACGAALATPDPNLTRIFPEPDWVTPRALSTIGMPAARRKALLNWASAAPGLEQLTECDQLDPALDALIELPGIGPWTAHYVALRALRLNDAFPASDIGLRRAAERIFGHRPSGTELERYAERWRPWRGYAAQLLWWSA